MISVVINTRNEAHRLSNALASVGWADEWVVVDMESEDQTVEIARAAGARVFSFSNVGFVEPARQFAIEQTIHPWVLVLDADEMVPIELAQRIQHELRSPAADAYEIPRANYLLGQRLRATGWAADQDAQLRLFRREAIEFPGQIHQNFRVRAEFRQRRWSEAKDGAIVHFNYTDVRDFLERLNRYTDIEAQQLVAQNRIRSRFKVLRNAWRAFGRRYYKQNGRQEGWAGFYLSIMMAFYTLATEAKAAQLREVGARDAIQQRYDAEARRIRDAYSRADLSRLTHADGE